MISIEAFAPGSGNERATPARKEQWFVATRAGIFPMTPDAIEQSLERGLLHARTKVWTSGMRAWESLGSIAGFMPGGLQAAPPRQRASHGSGVGAAPAVPWLRDPEPDEPSPAPRSYPPPLPAPRHLSAGPASVSSSPPVAQTVIPPRIEARSPSGASRPLAPVFRWVQSRETWHCVLFSLAAGTVLGLVMYPSLLWRASTESVSQLANGSQQAGAELTQRGPRAAAASEPSHGDVPERVPLALDPARASAPSTPLERVEARPESAERSATPLLPPAMKPTRAARHRRSLHRAQR